MSDHEANDQDPLEAALRQLTPAPPTFGKDRLVFLAGQASGRHARWRVTLLAALVGVGAGMVGTFFGVRAIVPAEVTTRLVVVHVPAPAPVAPVVPEAPKKQVPQPAPPVSSDGASSGWDSLFAFARPTGGYLQMRDEALRRGVEAMPNAAPAASAGPEPRPSSVLDLQAEMVGKASEF